MKHPYANPLFLKSLGHIGRYVDVPAWGTGVLARFIPGTHDMADPMVCERDIVGSYPLAVLDRDADLAVGLEQLRRQGFITVTLVLDEWHRPPDSTEWVCFDRLRVFKTHYAQRGHRHALGTPYEPSKGHWRHIERARKAVTVRPIRLEDHLVQWCDLYEALIVRRELTGAHAFSRDHFAQLAQVPGIEAIGAFVGSELVACNLWAVHNGRAHSHLVASSDKGYETEAMYAVTDFAFHHYADCDLINLGGNAGAGDAEDGLSRFKKGFVNSTTKAYIAGAILNRGEYERMSEGKKTDYFPAYRGGE